MTRQFLSDNKENIGTSCKKMLFPATFKRPFAPSKKDPNKACNAQANFDKEPSFIIPLKTSSIQNLSRTEAVS
jgi:hypothetical protein